MQHHCPSPPRKDETPRLAGTEGFKGQSENSARDDAGVSAEGQSPGDESKEFATLRAELARKGFTLRRAPWGGHLIQRWGHLLHVSELSDVERFARKAGAV